VAAGALRAPRRRAAPHRTSRNSWVDIAPRVPALKLSMYRTQLRSMGTVVPPEVTQTTGRARLRPSGPWCRKKASIWPAHGPGTSGQVS
jgi:hypothetical protein